MPHVSIPALIIILVIVVLLFGSGRVAKLGAELGVAVREFKKGLEGDEATPEAEKPKSELPPKSL
jgi:sec-independent protein translocase protein TatA